MKKSLPVLPILSVILLLVAFSTVWALSKNGAETPLVTSFEECAEAGYPILKTYPEQCTTPDSQVFTKPIDLSGTAFGTQTILHLNEQIEFIDGLTVTLIEINDSRCPSDVVCIWAGELAYQFKLLGGNIQQETKIRLGTLTADDLTQDGYTFTLDASTETTSTITVTKN
jgi:hypothetical protein